MRRPGGCGTPSGTGGGPGPGRREDRLAYIAARRVYARFREGLAAQQAVLDELLLAMQLLLNEYHTSIRENRFIVGGAAERLFAVAMRAVGLEGARARGLSVGEEDLVVGGVQLSLKCSFTGRRDAIRLINSLGGSAPPAWEVPTLFALAGAGIGYADPEQLGAEVHATHDAVILKRDALDAHFQRHPDLMFPCAVPHMPRDPYQRRAASEAVVKEILLRSSSPTFPHLRAHL